MSLTIPRSLYERLKREAEEAGLSLEELIIERLQADPVSKALDYAEASQHLLEQAKEEVVKGDLRQAGEKVWGAAALAIKAMAYHRDRRRLVSHGELREYKDIVAKDFGDMVFDAWHAASSMHTNFYEGWATRAEVEDALRRVERFVEAVADKVKEKAC